ncbi:MFS transporter [Paraburkholderia caballeronis]|uniref:MFS transporter, DHA2 family, methylenomycin A resistance protein n=1 Tax=Paraburkholderia caballeronis TaxID=416943 RepID=A0A1H7U9J0_9BURK|nr:MFS transporter [Paraburkholderia caballeronis]PXW23321.1 DHA2 family methylenomycin A resistance protein-like MFS transporter [Paraburkholderia caballeronis]PXW98314.1 DHA2 family methylenomycin A resistance protein-like MFS transporter [Paraburkholderia caballeronis]RAJ95044.1 DHA2 family methylenomycin A resistance protein-like MFS transporter [Paraburkholderia caballeronis]SEC60016.1 MFS transporter, DHA2 family, methylenomycin A resistance protein [Paraburkholderia caballeronis]SEL9361
MLEEWSDMKMRRVSPQGTLVAAAFGFVVVLLDVSVVNVALDALRRQFGTEVAGLQWVVNAYTLVFAALLLSSGALGDRLGPRRMFLCGLALFTLASAACGGAASLRVLVAARLLQGIGAALLVPNSLAMLQRAFPDKERRSRAVGWWGAIGGISLAAGPVVGGALVTQWGWRSIFLINLPIGFVGMGLTLRYVQTDGPGHDRSLDWPGQLAAILSLGALTATLAEAGRVGWTSAWVTGGWALTVACVAAFVWIESRGRSPMLPLELFRAPGLAIASLCGVIVNFAYYGLIFVFSLFFQIQQHLSPQLTGLAFLPMTVVLVAVNVLAGRMISRIGARRLMTCGLAAAAFGYLLLLPVRADGAYAWLVAPMLLAASGIALIVPTMTNVTLSSVDATRAGIASGVLNAARQVGGLLGVAVFGYLVRNTDNRAFMAGMHRSIGLAVALLAMGALLCGWRLGADQQASDGMPKQSRRLRPAKAATPLEETNRQ